MNDIEFNKVGKTFGDNCVLSDFTYVFKRDAINFIVGSSGIGKTTIVRILAGLEKTDTGYIEGLNNVKLSMVFQDDSLCENLSIRSNIKMVTGKEEGEVLKDAKILGLDKFFKTRVNSLSGGMKRRVSILRAFSVPFDIIILDEPFKGLDMSMKRIAMDYVIERLKGKMAVIITHALDEVRYFEKNGDTRVEVLNIDDI